MVRSPVPAVPRLLPAPPAWLRLSLAGVLVASLGYALTRCERPPKPTSPETALEIVVKVPQVDRGLLATADDDTREQRLLLETEPLRHLLSLAIDVGPSVAAALGIPEQPVPIDDVQAAPDAHRARWLWYEGKLVQLLGPRDGHPIAGYSIYEAIVEVGDEHVIAAFSIAPERELVAGDWVRVEGFFLKLRDLTYPLDVAAAPMLVGRSIQRDYEDWPAITAIDHDLLATVDDSSWWPKDKRFHTVEEDQTPPLWHLGAYARDTAGERTLADWRKIPALSAGEPYERLRANELVRGEPMRVFGSLFRRETIAAPANPANIRFWTVALIQVREFGGHLVPVWVPKRVRELPQGVQLEVRGFYYRWFGYEAESGDRISVPLFVAADLDVFDLESGATMRVIGIWIGSIALALLVLLVIGQRRLSRKSLAHSREMDERRRRRRERAATTARA